MDLNLILTHLATFGGISELVFPHSAAGVIAGAVWLLTIERTVYSRTSRWAVYSLMALGAVCVSEVAAGSIGVLDPSTIIIDEFVAIPFIFLGYAITWHLRDVLFVPTGLILFGLFDRTKILGIAQTELLPGGIGVVADDLAAALLAAVVLTLLQKVWGRFRNPPTSSPES